GPRPGGAARQRAGRQPAGERPLRLARRPVDTETGHAGGGGGAGRGLAGDGRHHLSRRSPLFSGVAPGRQWTALTVSWTVPAGTLTETRSPCRLPTSARPTGDSTAMRPAPGSASTAPTRW